MASGTGEWADLAGAGRQGLDIGDGDARGEQQDAHGSASEYDENEEEKEERRLEAQARRPVPLSEEEAARLTKTQLKQLRMQEAEADRHRRPEDLEAELRTLPQQQAATWHSRMQSFVSAVYDDPDAHREGSNSGNGGGGGGGLEGDAELQTTPKYSGLGALSMTDPIRFERLALAQRLMDPDDGVAPYCVFCVHGTEMLRADNTRLLSQFVGRDGALFPRRMTNVCAKHQRKLARTIKKSRWMGLVPLRSKLHPALRSVGMGEDDFGRGAAGAGDLPPVGGASAAVEDMGLGAQGGMPSGGGPEGQGQGGPGADLDAAMAELSLAIGGEGEGGAPGRA